MQKLSKFGFEFERKNFKKDYWYMKDFEPEIEINCLEDFLKFSKEWGNLILNAEDMTIEIYDGYRE